MTATHTFSSPLQFFSAVYLINLPERTDRLSEAVQELKRLDPVGAARVVVSPGVRATEAHGFPSVGAYGCFQAHLAALRAARDAGLGNVLILEDDLHVRAEMQTEWTAVQGALVETEWGLLNLGYDVASIAAGHSREALVAVHDPLMLAHCYAVNGPTLAPLIAYLEALQARAPGDPRGGPMHFDGALYHFAKDNPAPPRLRTRVPLVDQRSSRSDIASKRWLDLPLLAPVTSTLRRWKNVRRA